MKLPDEIKKAMAYCIELCCPLEKCPYYNAESCATEKTYDALALIQQLEAQNAELLKKVEQLQAERDAAVAALKSNCVCTECKWFDDDLLEGHCNDCHSKNSSFEWRGVQKEE